MAATTEDDRSALRSAGWEFYEDGYWRRVIEEAECIVGGENADGYHWSVWGLGKVIRGINPAMVDAAQCAQLAAAAELKRRKG